MSSLVRLVITSNGTDADFKSQCNLAPLGLPAVNNFVDYVAGLSGGNVCNADLAFKVGAVQATTTITFASTGPTNDQTCKILGVTFTAKTSASSSTEFTRSNTPSVNATNLAAKINAYSAFTGVVTAAASSGVITLTCVAPGTVGNLLAVCENVDLSNTTFAAWAGGTDGTAYNINLE